MNVIVTSITIKVFLIASLLAGASIALAKEDPLSVSSSPLSELLISSKFSAPANIISLNHSTISAEITGRALKIQVEAGDFVKQGKKLATIDCRSYTLAKKQATAALKVARTQFNYAKKQLVRNQRLVKQGTISRAIFDETEAAQLTALADIDLKKVLIDTANLAISRCQINAPFTGQITKRLVQKGQLVIPGTALFHLMESNRLEVKANLSPSEVKTLEESPTLEFVAGGFKLKTVVRSIIQTIDETTRTQEVRLLFPKNTRIAAGLSGRIEWSNKDRQLPAEYILRRGSRLGVMIVDGIVEGIGNAKFYGLANAYEGQPATINLPRNTAIITLNRYRAKDGQLVKIR